MAERQETSVMVSIQELLRDHQRMEEQEKVQLQRKSEEEEQARLDGLRRQQEDEERRVREEEESRQRKIFEEQRKTAELAAMHEATIQRARMEAEAQARLAEMASRQEHERHINALKHDKSKKTLKIAAICSALFLLFALVGGGIAFKNTYDKQQASEKKMRELQDEITKAEQEKSSIKAELENTKDPEKIAQLQAQLKEKDSKIQDMNQDLSTKGTNKARPQGPAGPGGVTPPAGPGKKAACNCAPGDPLCSCL